MEEEIQTFTDEKLYSMGGPSKDLKGGVQVYL